MEKQLKNNSNVPVLKQEHALNEILYKDQIIRLESASDDLLKELACDQIWKYLFKN